MKFTCATLLFITLAMLGGTRPLPAQSDAGYVIGAGDVLQVKVPRHPEFDAKALTVPPSGTVELPVLGALKVLGKNLGQIDAEITKLLATQIGRPEVDVFLVSGRARFVTVNGQVAAPGRKQLRERWRVTEALTASGGLKISSDRVSIAVVRGGRKLLEVPAQTVITNPASSDNILLQDNDRLEVAANSVQVTVSGEVQRPGVISAPLGSGVIDILDLAGGTTEEAALNRVILTPTAGKPRALDLRRPPAVTNPPANFRVAEGDTITVPALKDHISILGAVRKPGFYGLEEGRKLFVADALKRAGGASPRAILSQVRILHSDGRVETLNLTAAASTPVELTADDVLTVPVAKEVTVEGEVARPGKMLLAATEEPRISDALDAAGGLKRTPEDARISVVRRIGQRRIELRVDVKGLLVANDTAQNVLLQEGDLVKVVPGERIMVMVAGPVRKPGVVDMRPGQHLSDAIKLAGGPTDWASLDTMTIVRRDAGRIEVDGNAALKLNAGVDLELQDGDQVVVERLSAWMLTNSDGKTSEYPLPEKGGLTVESALAYAKVPLPQNVKFSLLRRGPDGVRKITIDSRSKNTAGSGLKTFLQAGDTIVLPPVQKPG